jgi:DNA primase
MYIDFKAIKAAVSIEDAANLLKLTLKANKNQLRGACPGCSNEDERILVITPARGLFYCFDAKVGGDCLALVQHITGLEVQDAAQFLAPQEATVPQAARAETTVPKNHKVYAKTEKSMQPFDPAAFASKLAYVPDLGLTLEEAVSLGVGEHRGKFYVALRDEFGHTAGFVAVNNPTFPKTLLQNTSVVKLKRA